MNAKLDRGCFLTLEGGDGAGKTTFIPWIVNELEAQGIEVVRTREPGGTTMGEKLRDLTLHEPMDLKTEVLLMFASRAEHIKQVIEPALRAGKWVVCDRFTDSSFAYQGGGRKLGGAFIEQLERLVHPDLQPDLTWFFDVPLEVARQRMSTTREMDRFELEGQEFFLRTQNAYHERMRQFPDRIVRIDACQTIEQIKAYLAVEVQQLVASRDRQANVQQSTMRMAG